MTVDELDLLVRAVHRDFKQDPKCITSRDGHDSFFYKNSIHLFNASSCNTMWPTIDEIKYECSRPWWFKFKSRKKYDAIMILLKDIGDVYKYNSIEAHIIAAVPAAKDIIAERALVGDHDQR